MTDPLVMPIALEMLACLESEISTVDNPPAYVGLRPGQVVDHLLSDNGLKDECCEGLAWVRPANVYPTTVFPGQDSSPVKTGPNAYAVQLELGVVRCSPTPDTQTIPTNAQWLAVVQAVMDDAAAMRRAICCYIAASPIRRGKVLFGAWTPIGTSGGCAGGTMIVTIQGPACDCSKIGQS